LKELGQGKVWIVANWAADAYGDGRKSGAQLSRVEQAAATASPYPLILMSKIFGDSGVTARGFSTLLASLMRKQVEAWQRSELADVTATQ
jgi:hypothetical protein